VKPAEEFVHTEMRQPAGGDAPRGIEVGAKVTTPEGDGEVTALHMHWTYVRLNAGPYRDCEMAFPHGIVCLIQGEKA
jgi:hypothetical protein